MQVTFVTDQSQAPETLKGEPIHFGSPRSRQLFDQLTHTWRLYSTLTNK